MCISCSVSAKTDSEIRVLLEHVNLRARPSLTSEVVGQVNYGDVLMAKKFKEEWVKVVPPPTLDLWVHQTFLENDQVSVATLNVRAGAGINFNIVGQLKRGMKIKSRGTFGEWVKIEPPASASLWVHRTLVEVIKPIPKPKPLPKPQKPTTTRTNMLVEPKEDAQPPGNHKKVSPKLSEASKKNRPPKALKLIPLDGQGLEVERVGILTKAGFVFKPPARYRLVRYRGNYTETICYVYAKEDKLLPLKGKRVLIHGHEYWVHKSKYPVVVPRKIEIRDAVQQISF